MSTEKCEQIRVLSRNECLGEMVIGKGGIEGHRGGNRCWEALNGGLVPFRCS